MNDSIIGVFGGSGFSSFLDEVEHVVVETRYGAPSAPVALGTVTTESGVRRVAFLPRHGVSHELPPHRINYRANVWAMHTLGVERLLAPCASGSLRAELQPGHLVVCDQLVDRTSARAATFFEGPVVNHVSFADPYCNELRDAVLDCADTYPQPVHDGGTVVVVEGPRFSTRAESRWFRAAGCDLVNMTQHPEAALARELGICYAAVAVVTDYDSGLDDRPDEAPVTQDQVFALFAKHLPDLRDLLVRTIAKVPASRSCACMAATNGIPPVTPVSSL